MPRARVKTWKHIQYGQFGPLRGLPSAAPGPSISVDLTLFVFFACKFSFLKNRRNMYSTANFGAPRALLGRRILCVLLVGVSIFYTFSKKSCDFCFCKESIRYAHFGALRDTSWEALFMGRVTGVSIFYFFKKKL